MHRTHVFGRFTFDQNFQADATSGLISLMALYPPDTRFFLNTWTWGYEDVIKAVARSFGSKVRGAFSKLTGRSY